jgi:membrane protein
MHWIRAHAWPTVQQITRRWNEDDGWLLSAAMAYYGAFSLFPLCLVLIAGLGLFTRYSSQGQNAQDQLLAVAAQNVSPWVAEQLDAILSGVQTNATVGGPVGLIVLVVAALGIFSQLERIFDRIWAVKDEKPKGVVASIKEALFDRLIAFLMLLATGGFIIAIFVANLALNGVRAHLTRFENIGTVWPFVQSAISVFFYTLLFSGLYKTIPKVTVNWRHALAGGLVVAVIWQFGQQILSAFVIGEKYSAYGVVGSFIALMVWMYYASVVVFFGAEVVQTLRSQSTDDATSAANF